MYVLKLFYQKWLISGVYRPQTINDKTFNDDFIKTCDKITTKYDNFMYIAYQLYLMLIIHIYDRIYISNCLYLGIHI
jgi:hypothetical protein